MEITRSFDRKVQIKTYEPISIFSSRKIEIADDVSKEERLKISAELLAECEEEVNGRCEELLRIVKGKAYEEPPFIN